MTLIKGLRCLLLSVALLPLITGAEIYKWTDKNGKVHYSDTPVADETIEKVDELALSKNISSYTNVSVQIVAIDFGPNQNARRDASLLVMYTTTRCGYCAKARRYFAEHGIEFSEKNIELDTQFREEFDQIGGKGVPVIIAGNKKMTGFSESKFKRNFADFLSARSR
jgi:glutaredoxin